MTVFIDQLQADIAQAARDRAAQAQRLRAVAELPTEAYWGRVWLRSMAGSLIECTTHLVADYRYGPLYETESVQLTDVSFHTLARADRAHFRRWQDFQMYDMEQYHAFLDRLMRAGFQLMVDTDPAREPLMWDVELRAINVKTYTVCKQHVDPHNHDWPPHVSAGR